ncbi:pyridoxamine 5'-phosphate oxidase family protein [Euzebya tangerina]|uniref:pyridoxamine 5'-phosphate oxidase family protein n=1 Tax=Euzebya tangerina TaxID=591198 RepID=UPI000E30B5ED|nr:pyridoxamine 5'-phosphate oxidase family protein [Euzebya tangerina]
MTVELPDDFDLEALLNRAIPARLATAGPVIRPIWFIWEAGSFWWLTGDWSSLTEALQQDPEVCLVVDTCDLLSGEILTVTAWGRAEVVDFDRDRAQRKLSRYLGADPDSWPDRFAAALRREAGEQFVRLTPRTLRARDLSFERE